MLACKGIFAKPSISQPHEVRRARQRKDLVTRLSAYIIARKC